MSSPDKPSDPKDPQPERTAGSESEAFLARWSRRKSEAREVPPANPETAPVATPEPEPIDPATLPSIESLTADSDFTVFLRPGVPEALRNAALQKLWRTEPSVVNYVPLVEYNWDFNAPGYGALKAGEDVAKIARQVWNGIECTAGEPAAEAEPAPTPAAAAPKPPAGPPAIAPAESPTQSQPAPAAEADPVRRRHGGALPT